MKRSFQSGAPAREKYPRHVRFAPAASAHRDDIFCRLRIDPAQEDRAGFDLMLVAVPRQAVCRYWTMISAIFLSSGLTIRSFLLSRKA
jgi:hypothetical protein